MTQGIARPMHLRSLAPLGAIVSGPRSRLRRRLQGAAIHDHRRRLRLEIDAAAIDGDRPAHCAWMQNKVHGYFTRDIQSQIPNHLSFESWSLNGDLIDAWGKRW